MPEMPEVETLARTLRSKIIGKRVAEVSLSGLPLRRPISDDFASSLQSRTIHRITRKGKYLIAELEPKAYWLIHLGMSGMILFHPQASAATRHTHAVIRFSDASELEYRDHRRFGLLAAYEVPRISLIPEIRSLGMDPLSPGFNGESIYPLLRKCEQEIKSFLLDQRKIAGIGNIYACESLFLARIHPARRCNTLDAGEAKALASAVKDVLKSAIRHKGTTFSDFRDSEGNAGANQDYLMVFQRENRPCRHCRRSISRMRQSGRSSFFCPRCQV